MCGDQTHFVISSRKKNVFYFYHCFIYVENLVVTSSGIVAHQIWSFCYLVYIDCNVNWSMNIDINANNVHISKVQELIYPQNRKFTQNDPFENRWNHNLSFSWFFLPEWMRENVFLSGRDWLSGWKWLSNHDNNKQRYSYLFLKISWNQIRRGIQLFCLISSSSLYFIFIFVI